MFPPTEEDLSQTGEYALQETILSQGILPTKNQTRPRTTFEALDEPAAATRPSTNGHHYKSSCSDSESDASADRNVLGSKRTRDGEVELSAMERNHSKKLVVCSGSDGQDKSLDSDLSSQGQEHTESMHKVDGFGIPDPPEEPPCKHIHFSKDDGTSSHGLWPSCAMICGCGAKIIQARGTDMRCIGQGDEPTRLLETVKGHRTTQGKDEA